MTESISKADPSPSAPAAMAHIAVAGNPNTGKTTLFNRLTGLRQRIGNYPGVTVEKKVGLSRFGGQEVRLVDLPGTYSLAASSADERIAIDYLSGHMPGETRPDLVLCVVDATNLLRNLYLVSQISESNLPVVVALTMWDSASKEGTEINAPLLSERLGVPVVPVVASRGTGIPELQEAVIKALEERPRLEPMEWPEAMQNAVQELGADVREQTGAELTVAEVRRLLFDRNSAIVDRIGWDHTAARDSIEKHRQTVRNSGLNPLAAEALLHYRQLQERIQDAINDEHTLPTQVSERIDKWLMNRVLGVLIFLAMMTVVFQAVYAWAGPFMDVIEVAKGALQDWASPAFEATPILQSLVVDGMIEGVGAVVVFLPQILILFLFISILEDSGYMARAAFLMDKLFSWCGLNGKSFVPMLSSYACAVPGIMATRTIEDPRARLTTILISPLMSCSARLPVYVLLIGAFVEPIYGAFWAGVALLGMHLVGAFVALPVAWLLNRVLLKTPPSPFVLEMPPYRLPRLRDTLIRLWGAAKEFVVRAGTIIFAITLIVWGMLYFPRPDDVAVQVRDQVAEQALASNAALTPAEVQAAMDEPGTELNELLNNRLDSTYVEQSFMGRLGKGLQPIFAPAGFDWKITVGVLASFPAREVIISTLGTIYSLSGDVDEESGGLREALRQTRWESGPRAGEPVFNIPVVFAIMVFFALCLQCGATVAAIIKESSWGWGVFSFVYMTALAWLGAVLVYQVGMLFVGSA